MAERLHFVPEAIKLVLDRTRVVAHLEPQSSMSLSTVWAWLHRAYTADSRKGISSFLLENKRELEPLRASGRIRTET